MTPRFLINRLLWVTRRFLLPARSRSLTASRSSEVRSLITVAIWPPILWRDMIECVGLCGSSVAYEGLVMRMIAVLAVLLVALLPLGGCFFHHNQAVVAQPLRPLK